MTAPPAHLPSLPPARWCVVAAWLPELEPLAETLPPALRRQTLCATVGIGLVEAAAGAARLIAERRPEALLLVGTAGVYPGREQLLPLGSAAIVDRMVLVPTLLPATSAYVPELIPTRERCSPALVEALRQATRRPLADAACAPAITASREAATLAAERSQCALENLEAFAVARAAASAGIPFAAMLGVANHVGPDGHREWQQHGQAAAAAACAGIVALLRHLTREEG